MAGKTTVDLPITGMTCASCVARNEKTPAPDARRGVGRRQPGDRVGPGHLRLLAGERRRPGRGRQRRRLRRQHRLRDAADRGHDVRQLRRPGRAGGQEAARRGRRQREPGDRAGQDRLHPRRGGPGGIVAAVRGAGYDVPGAAGAGAAAAGAAAACSADGGSPDAGAAEAAGRRLGCRRGRRGARGSAGHGARGRLPESEAQGGAGRRACRHRLPRQHEVVVPLHAVVPAERLRAVGAGHAGPVLGRPPVLPWRLGGAAPRHHQHGHADRPGLQRRLLLQRPRRRLPRLLRPSRPRASRCTSTRPR